MKTIELSRREPLPGDPRQTQYAGQRTAQEVFEELKHRLEGMGCLPDEYFLMDREWENGREIPKGADIFCTTDYGSSEGAYLDVYLKWYESDRPVTKSFITGKTLGESGADLDRMFLISSAITKAFHGDHGTYARYLRLGEQAEPEDMIVHLSPAEQRTIINALVEQRERQEQAMSQTEQLLRRMTGSITAYMDEVGQRPLHMSDYDKTVLAIRDGEFDAFQNLYPRVPDRADDLLIEVAGRPGVVGGNMTLMLLAAADRFSPDAYLTACKRAVETGDSQRVQTLVKEAKNLLAEQAPSLPGEVILYAYTDGHRSIAKDLITQCTPEQIAAAPKLLRWAAEKLDFQTAVDLVDKGAQPGDEAAGILRALTGQRQEWMAEHLLERGMPVEPDNYAALYACVSNQAPGTAKLLLDHGMDLEKYKAWAEYRPKGEGYAETMEELAAYWSEPRNSPRPGGFAHGRYELMSVGAAAAIKAAIAVLSNEEARKKVGWVIVAILSPLIVLVVLLCAILSGTSQHNVSAVELCFHGGSISASATPEYRGYIEEMRNSFARIDDVIAVINSQCEDGKSLDDTRVKAIFYALYFAAEQPGADGIRTFADCFVDYEERTRTVIITDEDGNVTEATETYTVATPVEDLAEIYERISQGMGIEVTTDHQSNADSIYSLILYGSPSGESGGWFPGADVPFIGADGFCSPIGAGWESVVTSEFGYRSDPFTGETRGHTGMDLAVPTGTPVRAALPGTVTVSQYNAGGYGYYVMIDHGNGLSTLYGHNSRLLAQVGQTVEAGDIIALSGSTGRSTGPHLHFEVRVNGERTNPRFYLPTTGG